MHIKNIFITGDKGVGKSTLIEKLIVENDLEKQIGGFKTLPYYDVLVRKGFYLHSLLEVAGNDQPISWQKDDVSCEPIACTFESLGVELLETCLRSDKPYVLMDEVGVLEREAYVFQNTVIKVLASHKIVIGVLKDKPHSFLQHIKGRSDTKVYTLEGSNFNQIFKSIQED
ncbi:MAG: nucleoside-triphosphatase, partial [Niameybacter sp.]